MKIARNTLIVILCINVFILNAQDTGWQTYYERSDYLATPRYNETIEYCKKLADASPMIEYTTFGISPQGRNLPLMIIDKNANFTPESVKRSGNAILMVQAGIHAGEIEGKDAMLMLIRDMVIHQKDIWLLDHVTIIFIPIMNVDGHEYMNPYNRINQNGPEEIGLRATAQNLNLNRDFLKADQPEMKAWLKLFQQWLPDFFIDVHTSDGADYQYVLTYIMEIYGNMDEELTAFVRDEYLPEIIDRMDQAGFPVFEYVAFRRWFDPRSGLRADAAPPRISQSYVALQNRIGLCIETHMLKPYKERVESTYELVKFTLDFMTGNYQELIDLNHQADAYVAGEEFKNAKFPLKFKRSETDSVMVEFKGVEYDVEKSELTGGDWFRYHPDKPVTYFLPMFNNVFIEEEVNLPVAYVVPPEWVDVIDRLKLHGVKYIPLQENATIPVEIYKFHNPEWQARPYESRHPMRNIEYDIIEDEVEFPAGSAIVMTNQRTARVIANILEPLAEDSYVYWGFFDPIFERKEYFETYIMEEIAREMIAEDPQLLDEFNQFKVDNPGVENNPWGQLWWFYERSPYYSNRINVYPVGRIVDEKELQGLPMAR